jgi:threonine synthase
LDLYNNDWDKLTADITGYTFSDSETRTQMRETYQKNDYTLDPHGAVGLLGLKRYLAQHPSKTGFFLETAHPAKFKEVVDETLGSPVSIPEKLKSFIAGTKRSIPMNADFDALKGWLLKGVEG